MSRSHPLTVPSIANNVHVSEDERHVTLSFGVRVEEGVRHFFWEETERGWWTRHFVVGRGSVVSLDAGGLRPEALCTGFTLMEHPFLSGSALFLELLFPSRVGQCVH